MRPLTKFAKYISTVLLLTCSTLHAAFLDKADTLWTSFISNFEFFPEYHLKADVSMYFLQRHNYRSKAVQDYYYQRYFVENNTNLEFAFLSFRKKLYSIWQFDFQAGMGKTPNNVVFDPMDMNFGIVPTIEYRLPSVNIHAGLDHHCFHEIDRKNFPTVYYNKLVFGAASPNNRLFNYWQGLQDSSSWTLKNRFSWSSQFGVYLTKFFGLVEPRMINGGNTKRWELCVGSRFAFYHRKSWIVNLRLNGTAGYDANSEFVTRHNGIFGAIEGSIEGVFRRGDNGGMFYLTYTFDRLRMYKGQPRFSRSGLLNFGIRLFN